MNNRHDEARDPRTGRPPLPNTKPDAAVAKRQKHEVPDGEVHNEGGERPEALAQFAQSAREGEESPKKPTGDKQTAPTPTSNMDKHEVATRILNDGAEGEHSDPHDEGVDKLPDRIRDSR